MTFHKSSFITMLIIVVSSLIVLIGSQTYYNYKKNESLVECQIVFSNIVDIVNNDKYLNHPLSCHDNKIINNNSFDLNESLIFTSDSYNSSYFPHFGYGDTIDEILDYNPLNKSKSWIITVNSSNIKDYKFVVRGASIRKDFDDKEKIVWVDDNPIIFPGGVVIDIQ